VQVSANGFEHIDSRDLWTQIRDRADGEGPLVMDVREPREFRRGHVPTARSHPLSDILTNCPELPEDRLVVIVCRTGRLSVRAADMLRKEGYTNVLILEGGQRAWEAEGLLAAVDY
jgi:SulP family sulfate permease